MLIRFVIVLPALLALALPAQSQQPPRAAVEDPAGGAEAVSQPQPPDYSAPTAATAQAPQESPPRDWTAIEIVLSVGVLLFGAFVFALQTFLIVKLPLEWTPNAVLRFNGLTLIITGGILLVTAGYSNQQMAPVIGLLGAIAGYLLGAAERPSKPAGK